MIAATSFAIARQSYHGLAILQSCLFLGFFGFLIGRKYFLLIALWRLDHFTKELYYSRTPADDLNMKAYSVGYDYQKGVGTRAAKILN